ncbi:MAG: tetratricopeptide repeat protein [bacterium]|nr:tetratricopeptide repeat protein [bacterium]
MKIVSKLLLITLLFAWQSNCYASSAFDNLQKILNAAREKGGIDNDSLFRLLKNAESEFVEAGLKEDEAMVLNQLGILYEEQGKYRLAINCYYKALTIFKEKNDQKGIANEKNNIGLIHQYQKHYKEAIGFFQEAIQIGSSLKDQDILGNAYNNLAICYQEKSDLQMALTYMLKVYEIDSAQNNIENLALTYNNLGVIQTDLKNYNHAKYYLVLALNSKEKLGINNGLSNTYNNLAKIYLYTNKHDSALYFVNLGIKKSKAENNFPYLKDAYIINSQISEKLGRFSEALYFRKLGTHLSDSISNAENIIVLSQKERDYRELFDDKTNIEETSEREKNTLKTGLFILAFILSVILIIFMVYYLLKVKTAFKHLQSKQKKIEVQNKILQVKNIEVSQAKEAAEEAANAKSQFISTISHEIRTPLNAIIGVANLLNIGKTNPDQIENLNILKISSENLLQLVNNILDFSKMEAGKLQLENIDFNLKSLMFDVRELFSIKAMEKGIELLISYDEKIPPVIKGDPLRINQLLINLVNNSIKFTESGYVKIEVIVQLATINNVLLHFNVSDTGIGIPTNKQAEIFQSFTQADSNTTRKYGGTGLGLSICKRILENLHSKLQLESIVGKGSKFYFNINFEVSRSASIGKSTRTATFENSIQGKRVLVVEDNMMNVMVLRQFLQRWGVITEIALNGKEGVDRIMESNFDAILMDIHMPEMDGIEATKIIRKMSDEKKRNIPIIALTAENEMQFRQKVYEVGMNDYIFKPFNPDDLKERLGYALSNNQNASTNRFNP